MKIEFCKAYNASVDQCIGNLTRVLPQLQLSIETQSTASLAVSWLFGAVKYSIELACTPIDDDNTTLMLSYDPIRIPALKRPAGFGATMQVVKKMNQVFDRLSRDFGLEANPPNPLAIRGFRPRKFQWFDYLALFVIAGATMIVPAIIQANSTSRSGVGIDMCLNFGCGMGFAAFYYILSRFVLRSAFPNLFGETFCTNCGITVLKETDSCPVCKATFMQNS